MAARKACVQGCVWQARREARRLTIRRSRRRCNLLRSISARRKQARGGGAVFNSILHTGLRRLGAATRDIDTSTARVLVVVPGSGCALAPSVAQPACGLPRHPTRYYYTLPQPVLAWTWTLTPNSSRSACSLSGPLQSPLSRLYVVLSLPSLVCSAVPSLVHAIRCRD